jgi:hypothetical protein
MTHLHLLPDASMVRRPPEGFVNRQRTALEGADLDTLDAEVVAAGGEIMWQAMESAGHRPGRRRAQSRRASWYIIPAEAVEE